MGRRVTNGLTGNVGSSISSLSVVDNSLITVTTNQNVVIDPNGSGHVFTDAPFESTNATGSTTKVTGAITTSGGIGAAGQIHAAGVFARHRSSYRHYGPVCHPKDTLRAFREAPDQFLIQHHHHVIF